MLFPIRHIFQNILHPTLQNLAQGIQGGGGNGLAVFHAVDGVGRHPLFEDKIVLCDAFSVQRLVKGPVTDHIYHQ